MKLLKQKVKFPKRAVILALAIALVISVGNTRAQESVEDIKSNLTEKQQQLEELNSQIQDLQTQIISKQKEAASLRNEIAVFDLQIKQNEAKIQAVELEIAQLSRDILDTKISIEQKEEDIARQKVFLSETLRLISEQDSVSPIELTLGNDTFSEFLDQTEYASSLQEKTQELLEKIRVLKAELEDQQKELLKEIDDQELAKDELGEVQHALEQQRAGKEALLSQTRGQERLYQALLDEAAVKQEQVQREIFDLELSVREKLGDKSLPAISGLLRWPMSGILTQGYGNTGFTSLGYSFHNGLDIAAPAGTKIYAAGDGIVYDVGVGEAAYGNWVVIKHTISKDGEVFNIYSLYAHLRNYVVSPGQAVLAGDLIGYEGNTGNTTRLLYGPDRGYHLHFTIFDEDGFGIKEGAYQNIYGPYRIPYGYSYNPLDFLD